MNKAEIRALARAITELEEDDVDDSVLDMYIQDGFDRILALERRWPHFEISTTLTTVVGQRDYPVGAIGDGNVREISSIVNSNAGGRRLELISYDYGEQVWLTGSDYQSPPQWFSTWAGSIQLWPKPDSVYTLLVRGYRKPIAWYTSDATEVDLDDRLHQSLVYYACAQMYQLQEDIELSSFYRSSFDEAVRLAHADIVRIPSHQPLILAGGSRRNRFSGPLRDGQYWLQ